MGTKVTDGKKTESPDALEAADETLVNEIARRLVEAVEPDRIYLFCSRARGDARPDSDYDILVVVQAQESERRDLISRAYETIRSLRAYVQIVVFTADYFEWMLDAAASLPATVRREGRLLHAA